MTNGYQGPPPQTGGLPQSQNLQRLREKHEQLRKKHEQQKSQMESKGQDLRLAQVLVRALDPSLPKGFRQLGLKQVAQIVGVDPKGANVKEMIGVLSGLDPQSLEGLRRGVTEDISQMQPGQVTEVTKGLLSGSIPPEKMLEMIGGAVRPPEMKPPSPEGGEAPMMEPPMKLGGPSPGRAALPERAPVGPQGTPLAPGTEPMPQPLPKKVAPSREEAEGELAAMFGLEPGRYRVEDIRAAGYDLIPDDPVTRKKVVEDIKAMQSGTLNSLAMMNQIAGAVRGRPEVLDLPGGVNISNIWEQTVEFTKSLYNITDKVAPQLIMDSPQMREVSDKLWNWIGETSGLGPVARTADEIARTRAKIKSSLMSLSYTMARAEQGAGVLTNQDVLVTLESLGESQSPDVFIAALESSGERLYSKYKQTTKVQTGKEVPLAQLATDDVVQALNEGGIVPKGLWSEKTQATKIPGTTSELAQPEGVVKQAVPRVGKTLEEEEAQQQALVRREQMWGEERKGMERQQHVWAGERAEMAARGEERQERAEERAIAREERQIAEKRAERIQAAFVELGRAFRSEPVQVPAVGGGGAPMNPAAFQAGQIQRRQAPVIPQNVRRR